MDTFSEPQFHDSDAARKWFETILWPEGPVCPHCGSINRAYAKKRGGVRRCAEKECRKDFTVTMNTAMERSHIALHKWAQAFHLLCSSKKGISSHQLHRTLKIAYQSAWFMAHRIREAMRDGGLSTARRWWWQIVEADETYFGDVEERKPSQARGGRPYTKGGKSGPGGKRAVVSLVERGGRVRSFHPASADGEDCYQDRAREHRNGNQAAHGRKPPVHESWHRIHRPRYRDAFTWRVCPMDRRG